eukprot:TRINITY_DN4690_c0_g1_i1.p1 TRINITY_DN4690_c0_g1~~TRINITY_DN4690_c0_g1_i1.p1  ORF type:complete len:549 (-),score=143.10 TRINITY_DN4690_c0_g1_i1:139-1785(-)
MEMNDNFDDKGIDSEEVNKILENEPYFMSMQDQGQGHGDYDRTYRMNSIPPRMTHSVPTLNYLPQNGYVFNQFPQSAVPQRKPMELQSQMRMPQAMPQSMYQAPPESASFPFGGTQHFSHQSRIFHTNSVEDLASMARNATNERQGSGSQRLKSVKSQENMAGGKSYIKNTYINKINSLISEGKVDVQTLKKKYNISAEELPTLKVELRDEAPTGESRGEMAETPIEIAESQMMKKTRSCDTFSMRFGSLGKEREIEKLERNRESARNSRKRKKIYIDMLESKVAALHQELDEANGLLEDNNANLRKICANSNILNNLIIGRHSIFEKLEEAVQKGNESEASLLLDSLRYRLGATGKERQVAIKFYFRQLTEIFLPLHMKYLMLIASDREKSTQEKSLWIEMVDSLGLSESQKNMIMAYRKKIETERESFEGILGNLSSQRDELIRKVSGFQDMVDEMSNSLSPLQISKFLLVLDKHRNSEEFSLGKLFNLSTEVIREPLIVTGDNPAATLQAAPNKEITQPLIDINSTFELFRRTTEFLKKRKHSEL